MLVYFEEREDTVLQSRGRTHPWTETTNGSGESYVDFKARPDLIESSLPDLIPVRDNEAGRAILEFIREINGPDSEFETNDFGAKPIKENISNEQWPLEHKGRIVILYRDLRLNTRQDLTDALLGELMKRLRDREPHFNEACWGLCRWPHLFGKIEDNNPDDEGNCICMMWWAWGNTEDETALNTAKALDILKGILSDLSQEKPWQRMM